MKYKEVLDDLKAFLQTGDNFLKIFEQFFTLTETTDFIDHGPIKVNDTRGSFFYFEDISKQKRCQARIYFKKRFIYN